MCATIRLKLGSCVPSSLLRSRRASAQSARPQLMVDSAMRARTRSVSAANVFPWLRGGTSRAQGFTFVRRSERYPLRASFSAAAEWICVCNDNALRCFRGEKIQSAPNADAAVRTALFHTARCASSQRSALGASSRASSNQPPVLAPPSSRLPELEFLFQALRLLRFFATTKLSVSRGRTPTFVFLFILV